MSTVVFSRKELLEWMQTTDDFDLKCRIQTVLNRMGTSQQANVEITVVQEPSPNSGSLIENPANAIL